MVRIVDVAGERECGGGPRSRQLNCEEERQIDRSGRERLQFATYPPSPVSGPVRCCDVTDLCQAFSQRTGPGRWWISLSAVVLEHSWWRLCSAFLIAGLEDGLVTAKQFVLRGNVTDAGV